MSTAVLLESWLFEIKGGGGVEKFEERGVAPFFGVEEQIHKH
jgi:hypothetical protein